MFLTGRKRWLNVAASVPFLEGLHDVALDSISQSADGVSIVTGSSDAIFSNITSQVDGYALLLSVTAYPAGAVYTENVLVTLTANSEGHIYYTMDGTDPSVLIGDDGTAVFGDDGMEIIMDGG